MRKLALIYTLVFTGLAGFAQQDAQYTQYMYNTININPAYAGSRGALSIFALHRTQWVGLDGAPVTNAVSVNTPLNNSNLGLGVSIVSDKIGPTHENAFSVDLSYSIPTSENYKLSFGVKGTANLFDLDVSRLNPESQGDRTLTDYNNRFTPNVGAGLYLHSDRGYLGLSVPNFIETDRYDDNEVAIYTEKINYYLIGGYVFDLNYYLKLKPAFLTKVVQGAPLQVDLSANVLYDDKFSLGLAYRWSAAVTAMAGFQISDSMYIGYAYDLATTKLDNYNSGSHEIFFRYEIFKNNKRITTPRFF